MALTVQKRFRLVAVAAILLSLATGYFLIAAYFYFGVPFIPMTLSLIWVWISRVSVGKRVLVTSLSIGSMVAGFALFLWHYDATFHWPLLGI